MFVFVIPSYLEGQTIREDANTGAVDFSQSAQRAECTCSLHITPDKRMPLFKL
jgi:hypothetical protein